MVEPRTSSRHRQRAGRETYDSDVILEGKKILLAGMSDRRSIGYAIAQEAQRSGAELLLTSFGRMMSITQMTAKKLNPVPDILELDVTKQSDIAEAVKETTKRWDRVDGLVHSLAFAPPDALGGQFLNTPWESASTAFQVSTFSFKELARAFLPLMKEHGGSLVTIDFDNSTSAWPKYDWMGVSKAALESVTRYLARDLGRYKIRVNAVCAGPLATLAASGIPGFKDFEEVWEKRAPLGWNMQDRSPVGRAVCALLSEYLDMTTGELLHVDGGYHAMGTELPPT
ncbi:MAG: enoyl-ACP reductase FabI [Candidatus Dormibacteraceae bacterium]